MIDLEEDEFGHCWGIGWDDSDIPHPGFGGTNYIFGGYVSQCEKCKVYCYEPDAEKYCKGTENGKQGNI